VYQTNFFHKLLPGTGTFLIKRVDISPRGSVSRSGSTEPSRNCSRAVGRLQIPPPTRTGVYHTHVIAFKDTF
jgi:hypothetical protein